MLEIDVKKETALKSLCSATCAAVIVAGLALGPVTTVPAAAADTLDRTVLPIPEPKRAIYKALDAR